MKPGPTNLPNVTRTCHVLPMKFGECGNVAPESDPVVFLAQAGPMCTVGLERALASLRVASEFRRGRWASGCSQSDNITSGSLGSILLKILVFVMPLRSSRVELASSFGLWFQSIRESSLSVREGQFIVTKVLLPCKFDPSQPRSGDTQ
jgi:hypothetical protein